MVFFVNPLSQSGQGYFLKKPAFFFYLPVTIFEMDRDFCLR